jgi:hypothetical protein
MRWGPCAQADHDGDDGADEKNDGRRAAQHRSAPQQPQDVVVRLQQRLAAAAGHDRLGPVDHAQQ